MKTKKVRKNAVMIGGKNGSMPLIEVMDRFVKNKEPLPRDMYDWKRLHGAEAEQARQAYGSQ